MRFLSCERISEHKYKTPEGYLVCVDSILARTGKQSYRRCEIFHDDSDEMIDIDRSPDEVFSKATLASFENKPLTVEHPQEDVNVNNHSEYAVGFVRDIKRGVVDGQEVMLGTLVITDGKTIEEIENGEHTDLSCGYDCDVKDEANPQQRNIRGNHVALCKEGRAGIARIVDSVDDSNKLPTKIKNELKRILTAKSTFIRNREYDVSELVREIERWFKIDGETIKLVREKIDGWKKMGDGMMRKDYTFSIEGYDDRFLVSVYAKPDTYETTELNAYFLDSKVEDMKTHDVKPIHENIREQIKYVMQSDVDKNLYFYIGEKYAMKEGNYTYQQYDLEGTTPEQLKSDLGRQGWHQVSRGPAPFIDSKAMSNVEDSVNDAKQYDITISADGFISHIRPTAYSEYDAVLEAKDFLRKRGEDLKKVKIISVDGQRFDKPILAFDSIEDSKIADRYCVGDITVGFKYKYHGEIYEVIKLFDLNKAYVKCSDGKTYRISTINLMEDLNGSVARAIDSIEDSKINKIIKITKLVSKLDSKTSARDSDQLRRLAYDFAQMGNYFDTANSAHSRHILGKDDERKIVEFYNLGLKVYDQLEMETENMRRFGKESGKWYVDNNTVALLTDGANRLYWTGDKRYEVLSRKILDLVNDYNKYR